MTLLSLQRQWEEAIGRKLHFRINDNRSTMLSVRRDKSAIKVSLHRMFLNAPQDVLDSLRGYLQSGKRVLPLPVRIFIEENVRKLDYSRDVLKDRLSVQGEIYNLQDIYDDLNQQYFDQQLSLQITWFGRREQKHRSSMTFGLYYDPLKLIKIHRKLDAIHVPEHVVAFIVYHEMLHHVCPSYFDEEKIHRIHTREFKEREKNFAFYQQSQEWIRKNQEQFFEPRRRRSFYGGA